MALRALATSANCQLEIADWLAEGVGFEPTRACALPVFKTGAINHSTTPPGARAATFGGIGRHILAHQGMARQIFDGAPIRALFGG